MELLLDTHTCLWWASEPERLAPEALRTIEDASNTVWVSAASAWELAIKVHGGRLAVEVDQLFSELADHGCGILGIGVDDAIAAGQLDWSHRDPFDRMLVAQALLGRRTLVTRDQPMLDHLGPLALAT